MKRDRSWARKKAEKLVSQMTLKEKASQLLFSSPALERLGVKEYNWWNEALHGVARAGTATVFPQAIGLGATFDSNLIHRIADTIATEGRAKYNEASKRSDRDIYKGLTFWSPNVNIFRDPRWGRGQETYGEDPYLTAVLGTEFVKGLQGDGRYLKAAACAKHFAVHSGPEDLRHSFNAEATRKDMEETYLPAFHALVENDVEAVMGAYNRLNGEPCCASSFLQKILRGEWGFEGHFVSDCWAIRDFHEGHNVTKNAQESAALALKRGCDLNCGCTYNSLLDAVKKHLISEDDITASCIRLFTTRFLLGMDEKTEWDGLGIKDVCTPEAKALALEAARKSIVMLKNDGILPLKNIKTLGVIGPNADNRVALYGNYHGTASRYITPLEGIEDEAEKRGLRVLYSLGCCLTDLRAEHLAKEDDRFSEASAVADASDAVVLILGLDETLEGEQHDNSNFGWGADKSSLDLPGRQGKLLELVAASGKPFIVIIEAGSAVNLSFASEKASAILDAWYPGEMGGKAIADILFGVVSPSAKLPVTFYRSLDPLPPYTDYSLKERTYRYASDENVLYPFGFGLTYGKAEVEDISWKLVDGTLSLDVAIRSEGETEDVLQVYVKDMDSPFAVRNRSLQAFRRVKFSGGTEHVAFELPPSAFESVDNEGKRVISGSRYSVSVGFSQPDPVSISLTASRPLEFEFEYRP